MTPTNLRGTRIAEYAAVIAVALLINFALPRALPGGPLRAAADPELLARLTAEERQRIAEQYGFARPLHEQFLDYITGVFSFDLGESFADGDPVIDDIGRAVPWTLLLVGTSLILAALIGVALGAWGGLRRHEGKGGGLLGTVLVLESMPSFWLGLMFVIVFGVYLQVLPTFGIESPRHLVLPVLTLVLTQLGQFFLYTRYSLLTVLTGEPVEHARARGVPRRQIVRRHALRPALLPVHTILMLQVGYMAGGALVVENVFAYPGLGRLTFTAIQNRDYPLMQGAFLVFTLMVIAMNALADATYPLLDPRARPARQAPGVRGGAPR